MNRTTSTFSLRFSGTGQASRPLDVTGNSTNPALGQFGVSPFGVGRRRYAAGTCPLVGSSASGAWQVSGAWQLIGMLLGIAWALMGQSSFAAVNPPPEARRPAEGFAATDVATAVNHHQVAAVRLANGPLFRQRPEEALRWKFNEGDQFKFTFQQSTTIQSKVEGNSIENSSNLGLIVSWKVIQAGEGQATIEMRYQQIDIEMNPRGAGLVKVSTDPALPRVGTGSVARVAEGLIRAVTPIIDQPFLVLLDDRGVISEVQMEAKLVEQIRLAPNSMAIRNVISQEGIQAILGSLLVQFPAEPARTWQNQSTLEIAGVPINQVTTYTLPEPAQADSSEGKPDPMLTIQFATEVDFPDPFRLPATDPKQLDPTNPTQPKDASAPFDFDPTSAKWPTISQQESSGTLKFDSQLGFATEGTLNSLLETRKAYSNSIISTLITTRTTVVITKE